MLAKVGLSPAEINSDVIQNIHVLSQLNRLSAFTVKSVVFGVTYCFCFRFILLMLLSKSLSSVSLCARHFFPIVVHKVSFDADICLPVSSSECDTAVLVLHFHNSGHFYIAATYFLNHFYFVL